MTDREILDKYIDLENSYLTKEEKKEVIDMLYKYREAFSLRMKYVHVPILRWKLKSQINPPFVY